MIYSLINVTKEIDKNTVEGYWIQDVIGTLDKAIGIAYSTNRINSFKLNIAIVPAIRSTVPTLNYWTNLKNINYVKNKNR